MNCNKNTHFPLGIGSRERRSDRARTQMAVLVMLDWDDCALPTSWMSALRVTHPSDLSPATRDLWQAHDRALASMIREMLGATECVGVMFVTNPRCEWMHRTAALFLPETATLLTKHGGPVTVHSARPASADENEFLDAAWKARAFERIIVSTFQRLVACARMEQHDLPTHRRWGRSQLALRVLMIGDMPHDIRSMDMALTRLWHLPIVAHMFRFIQNPLPRDMLCQWQQLRDTVVTCILPSCGTPTDDDPLPRATSTVHSLRPCGPRGGGTHSCPVAR